VGTVAESQRTLRGALYKRGVAVVTRLITRKHPPPLRLTEGFECLTLPSNQFNPNRAAISFGGFLF
jgi:hypothetical protein